MTNDEGSPNAQNDEKAIGDFFGHSDFVILSSFVIGHSSFLIVRTDLCNHV
jgi:hypothetical protein